MHQLKLYYISSTLLLHCIQSTHTHFHPSLHCPFPLPVITAQLVRWQCYQSPEVSSHQGVLGGWRRPRCAAVRTSHLEGRGDRETLAPSWQQSCTWLHQPCDKVVALNINSCMSLGLIPQQCSLLSPILTLDWFNYEGIYQNTKFDVRIHNILYRLETLTV